jgi:hypothetical protein
MGLEQSGILVLSSRRSTARRRVAKRSVRWRWCRLRWDRFFSQRRWILCLLAEHLLRSFVFT